VWKLDRFGRSLRHLVNALAELEALGLTFISLRDNLDLSTPSGRLMFQIIGAMAEFERALIQERVRAGIRNARAKGKRLGRPRVIVDASLGLPHCALRDDLGLKLWRKPVPARGQPSGRSKACPKFSRRVWASRSQRSLVFQSRAKSCDSEISKPAAKISSERRHGSFFPFSRSEMNGRPSPV
jgi:Resolvase, N terminal domain